VQQVADLVGPRRAVVADDTDGVVRSATQAPPVIEELGHGAMELLVG
jgi:hypothetical protein